MARDRTSALVFAGFVGLSGGLLLAACAMVYFSLVGHPVDCAPLSSEECVFAEQSAAELSRVQALAGAGLAAVGGGLALWLRTRRRTSGAR